MLIIWSTLYIERKILKIIEKNNTHTHTQITQKIDRIDKMNYKKNMTGQANTTRHHHHCCCCCCWSPQIGHSVDMFTWQMTDHHHHIEIVFNRWNMMEKIKFFLLLRFIKLYIDVYMDNNNIFISFLSEKNNEWWLPYDDDWWEISHAFRLFSLIQCDPKYKHTLHLPVCVMK